jgi:predicted ester cyclase
MSETTRAFAIRLMQEVWQPFDAAAVPRFYHPDMVGHHRAQRLGRDDVVRRLEWDRRHFSNAVYDIQDIVADSDRFALRVVYGCTLVATGQRFTTEVNYFYRLRNDRISAFWLLSDADFDYTAQA